jgi:purine-binding chemotaxis protein CheW
MIDDAAATGMDGLAAGLEDQRREFLTFRLGDETYGIDILQVQEIREIEQFTRVPRVASFVRGVINLRGSIVPIADLGLLCGFSDAIAVKGASAIILNAGRRHVGLVVSSVSDVVGLADEEIAPAPDLGERAVGAAIAGIGKRDGTSILLLDVEHVLQRIREDRA